VSDWSQRLTEAAREAAAVVQQGVDRLGAEVAAHQRATRLPWPPTAAGIAAVVGVPLTSLVVEDGPESTLWRAGGRDHRGNWQFEIHQGRSSALAGLATGTAQMVAALGHRHTWQWPVPDLGDGGVVCQDVDRPLQAACYGWRGDAIRWATAWVPVVPPDPRDLAVELVRALFAIA